MPKRTSPSDAKSVVDAQDLEEVVHDKREGWRASTAKARRRQRRYQKLLTSQLRTLARDSHDQDDPLADDDA